MAGCRISCKLSMINRAKTKRDGFEDNSTANTGSEIIERAIDIKHWIDELIWGTCTDI